MTQTKYTKGPWVQDVLSITSITGEYRIAKCLMDVGGADFIKAEANARLISYAPELLEVLEIIRDDLMKKKSKTLKELGLINLANQAIAKAKGE